MFLTAHRTILLDAAATTASALVLLAARPVLYPYFGLTSPQILDMAVVAFIAYAAIIALAARQPVISRTTLMTIVAANIATVLASIVVLVVFWSELHPVGRVLIFVMAVVVELFATLQYAAARKLPSASPRLA